jgi:hypothetical protein
VEFVEQVLLHKKRGVGGVPLEVLQEKRGVGLQLHVFLGAEFVELDVFGIVELERSWKTGAEQPQTPSKSVIQRVRRSSTIHPLASLSSQHRVTSLSPPSMRL